MILFSYCFKSNIAEIYQILNPTQQKFIVQLKNTDIDNKLYIIAEFKYIPLAYFYNNQTTNNPDLKNQLIFLISSESSPKVIAYLQLQSEIKLCLQLETIDIITQEIQIFEEQLKVDPYQIEGNWFTIEIRNNLIFGTTNITIYQNDQKSNFFFQFFENKNLHIQEIFQLESGLTQLAYELNISPFQGPIKLEQLDWASKHYPSSLSCAYNSQKKMLDQDFFSSESFFIYQLTQGINKCFGIQGWVKITKADLKTDIYVLTVFANPNTQINIRSEILTIIYQITEQKGQITLKYQSYSFPIPILDENQIEFSYQYILIDKNFLYDWHFLSIQYKENSLTFSVQYPLQLSQNMITQLDNVYFFSDTNQTILLGGYYSDQKLYNNASGDFFYFYYYYKVGGDFPTIRCNINCLTCFGPFFNQCITCSSAKHRIKYSNHECTCELGYVDIGDGDCQDSFSEAQINLLPLSEKPEYDKEQPIVVCSFGYFKYQDQCYKCPKINKKYPCFLCLQNPNDWIHYPKCDTTQQQLEGNDDYVYKPLSETFAIFFFFDKYEIYFFQNEELIFCQYCAQLCLTFPLEASCYLSSYYHLNQRIYVKCSYGFQFIKGTCMAPSFDNVQFGNQTLNSQETNTYCQNQGGISCQQCNENYFLSFNLNQCLYCGIQFCKICFQYSIFDQSSISLFSIETKYLDEDLVIGCALCFYGYQFNFNSGLCELITQQLPDCKNQYQDQYLNNICFETTSNDFSKGTIINQCQKYMFNCQRCFSPVKNQYYCVECEVGYYFSGKEGICIKCQNYDSNFLTCYSKYSSDQDKQLLDAIGFVFSFQKIYPINKLDLDIRYKVIPLKCIEGKNLFSDEFCTTTSKSLCQSFEKQCLQCYNDVYGTRKLTIKNLVCVDCPYYCEYCVDRISDVKLLNLYFNPALSNYNLQCLQKRNIEYIFIDNYFGLVRNCNSTLKKCESELIIISTIYEIFRSYFFLIHPDEIQQINIKAISIVKLVLNCTKAMVFSDSFLGIETLDNLFAKELLTLYQTEVLIYNSQQIYNIFSFANLQFINIQKIEFNYIQLNFSIFSNSSISLISQTPVALLLCDVTIVDSYFKPELAKNTNLTAPDEKHPGRSYQISINFPNNITFKNIFISNMSFINTQFIFLNFSSLTQLEIYNVINLTITNCNFISSIFSLINGQIFKNVTFNQVTLENCTFTNSSFLKFQSQLGFIYMSNIVVRDCIFQDAVILAFDQSRNVYLSDITFFYCIFERSKAISIKSNIYFSQLLLQECDLQSSQIIYGYSFNDNLTSLHFINFTLKNVSHINSDAFKIIGNQLIFYIDHLLISNFTSPQLTQNYIFSLFGSQLVANSINLRRNGNCQEFFFSNFSTIVIIKMNVTSQNSFQVNQQFLYINGQNIKIKDIYIQHQNILDDKLIFIQSLSFDTENQILELKNWQIVNCSCLKSVQKDVSSILFLNLLGEYQITLANSIFEGISQNQELQDPEIASANILVMNAPSSKVDFINITILNCLIANSSDSNLLIKTSMFRFFNSKANQINTYFNDSNNYIQFRYNQGFQFSQQSYGGLAYIQTQTLIVQNCSFTNILGLFGGTFYIVTKYSGKVQLANLIFTNQSSSLDQYSNGIGGVLFLDSDNSLLEFSLENIQVQHSSSSYQAGFLFIKPSRNSNLIKIKNLNLNNVFSKEGSIFLFLNSVYQKSDSLVIFNNISIANSQESYSEFRNYYQIINDLSGTEGLIKIFGSKIKVSLLSFQGYLHENLLLFDFYSLIIIHRLFISNTLINSQYLLNVRNLANSIKNYIYINQIQIMNCSNSIYDLKSFFGILLQNNFAIKVENIQFSLNLCSSCEALLLIQNSDSEGEQKINFNDLLFYANTCGQKGCLSLQFQQYNTQIITKLMKGSFISNQADFGGAINCAFINCEIKNSQFLSNIASQGGAVYLNNFDENQFQNNYFIENSAQIGGSLYFAFNSTLTNDSKVFLIHNKAIMFANNIAEKPRFLQFIINGVQIFNNKEFNHNIKIDRVNISEIFYPSGVKLTDYLYFNYSNLRYNKINYQILLKAYNHLYEEIIELDGSYCSILYPNEVNSSDEIQKLFFDSTQQAYDFNQIIFISDPYQQGILVDLQCSSISEEYHLQFVLKTFKCQIGEYFFENMCLRCNSFAGYYSVDQGTTCKRIDIAMIIETTGAMLNLQPQHWRPTLHSDAIEPCKNSPKKCLGGWYPGDASCIQGGVGGLCEECDLYNIQGYGHYFNSGTGDCKICGQFIIQSIWTVILTLMTYKSTEKSLQRLAQLKSIYLKFQTLYTFSLDQTSILIKMSNNYFQVLIVISTFQINFFHNLKDTFEFFGQTSSFMTYQFDCTLASFLSIPYIYSHYIMIIVITIFNHAFTTIIFISMVALGFYKFSSTYFYTSIFYLYTYNQQSILNWGLQLVSKRSISGDDYIQASVIYKYYTQVHIEWLLRFVIPIILFFGILIPLLIIYLLCRYKNNLYHRRTRKLLSYLINEYSNSSYYWEVVRIILKIGIIITVNFLEQEIEIKGILIVIFILFYYKLLHYCRPYRLIQFNQLESSISFNVIMTILLSIILHLTEQKYNICSYILEFLIIILILYIIITFMRQLFVAFLRRLNESFDFIRQFISYKFPKLQIQFPCLRKHLQLKRHQSQRVNQRFNKIKVYLRNRITSRRDELFTRSPTLLHQRLTTTVLMTQVDE